MDMNKNRLLPIFCLFLFQCLSACQNRNAMAFDNVISMTEWHKATDKVVEHYAAVTKTSLSPYFTKANISYPPKDIAMLAFKREQIIELWAKGEKNNWHHIKNYPLKAMSGTLGPKMKRNDGQIPEGIYKVETFNPFSSYHLSMMLNYPNAYDRYHARLEGRRDLGNNIFIHGKALSAGCLAVGDHAIDELFTLVNKVGKPHTQVIISPSDLRKSKMPVLVYNRRHPWVPYLYHQIQTKLSEFKEV